MYRVPDRSQPLSWQDALLVGFTRRPLAGDGQATPEAAVDALEARYELPRGRGDKWMEMSAADTPTNRRLRLAYTRRGKGYTGGLIAEVDLRSTNGLAHPLDLVGVIRPTGGLAFFWILCALGIPLFALIAVTSHSNGPWLGAAALAFLGATVAYRVVTDSRSLLTDLRDAIDGVVTFGDDPTPRA